MVSHVLLLNLAADLVRRAHEERGSLPVELHALAGGSGWTRVVEGRPALLVVGAHADAASWVAEYRARPGFENAPVLCVMDALEPSWVPRLKAAGVVRIMMRDEFEMDVGTILRAAAP